MVVNEEVGCPLDLLSFGCHLALLSAMDDLVCRPLSVFGMVKMYSLQLVLAAVAVEISVTQKLHLSFLSMSVTVVAGADGLVLSCFGCFTASQPCF